MKKLLVLLPLIALLQSCGFSNPETPAGFEGYVFESPRVYGTGGFSKILTGPSTHGFSFYNYNVINIDMRTKTYVESFKILAQDKINMDVRAELLLSLKKGSSKIIVEEYSGEKWYKHTVQEVFRKFVRAEVQKFSSGVLKEKRDVIEKAVLGQLQEYLQGSPIVIKKFVIGNLDFPQSIVTAIENRVAKEEVEKAKDIENRIAEKDAKIRATEAKGIAEAQRIIDKSLTNNYLQYEAIKAQSKMADSPNHTTIYIPVGNNGIPLMRTTK